MKRIVWITLAVCLLLTAYVGCKNKAKPISVPASIFRVTYSDSDQLGTANAGDQLFVQFDRHIVLGSSNPAAVFEFSVGGDSFGTGATMVQTSGHALTITFGSSPVLTPSIDDFITSQIRVVENPPFNALRDATWLNQITGGGTWSSIEGRLGYAAPVLFSAIYVDEDASMGVSADDTITLTFTGDVTPFTAGLYWPGTTFILPVNWDRFGAGASAMKTNTAEITIYLGTDAKVTVGGTHAIGQYLAESPSGIDIAIMMTSGYLTYDVGGIAVNVPPTAVDIDVP
jgi:hypothetical protein